MTQTFGSNLRNEQKIKEFLKLTVETTRKALKCDRVIIYNINEHQKGLVLAESVSQKYPSIIKQIIKDPFLEGKSLEMYSSGMPIAIDDIFISDKNRSGLRILEKIGVKSLMIAPIAIDNKLQALLVAHQCSRIQLWHHEAVIFLTEKATATGYALSNPPSEKGFTKQIPASVEKRNLKLVKVPKPNNNEEKYLQELLAQEQQNQTKFLPNPINPIENKQKSTGILAKKVEEIRRILNCDRVVVYDMYYENYGKITAESVAPNYTKAYGSVINDPCFESEYYDKYRNGRVRAIDNIHKSDLTPCYIEQLEKLEVKANIVAPILNEGRLFGLLVAHQCSNPRQWQQIEIFWLAQIAKQLGFTIDNEELLASAKQIREEVEAESKWTEYLNDAIQSIRQSLKKEDILHNSVQKVREILNCDRVVIYTINQDGSGMIKAESLALGWKEAKSHTIQGNCFTEYMENHYNGNIHAIDDIYQSNLTANFIKQLEELDIKANLIAPITNKGKLLGLLIAHQCSNPRKWKQTEIRWMAQIVTQIGFALDNAKVIEQLEQSTTTSKDRFEQKHQEIEILKNQIVSILGENGYAYQNLSQEAMEQSEITINLLSQIQKVADSLNPMALNVQQVKLQGQQNELAMQNAQESLKLTVNNIANVQGIIHNAKEGFDDFNDSYQELRQAVSSIGDLGKQIVQKSMIMTRSFNRSRDEENSENSIISLSEAIFSFMQQLFESIAQTEQLFTNIQQKIKAQNNIIDSGNEELVNGINEVQAIGQEIEPLIHLNHQMNDLLNNISQSIETQIQSSSSADDSVRNLVNMAERISEQSLIITKSFQQIVSLVQQL